MSLPDLEIRPYRPGDEHQILQTFNLVFREVCGPGYQDRTLEQWRWQYQDNPHGQRMSLAVAPDGTVVSQYAGVPMVADTPYGPQTFLHCVDSMTHPVWRGGLKRPGIFVITGLPFSAHSRRIGDALLYGFPVDVAFRIGQRHLEYHCRRVSDYLTRDVAAGVPPAPAAITVERVPAIPPDIGALLQLWRDPRQCLLRRDYRYLTWRYCAIPSHADYELWTARRHGRLAGLLVLRPVHELAPDACTIAEWMVPGLDADTAAALLAVACRRAHEGNRKRVLAVFAEPSREWQSFQQRGFARVPSATWMERRLVYLITGSPITSELLEQQWWYTLGDSDLV